MPELDALGVESPPDEEPEEEQEETFNCSRCDNNEVDRDGQLCQQCIDNTFECRGCDDRFDDDDANHGGGYPWCRSCFEESFSRCDSCENTYRNERCTYRDGRDETLCDECYGSDDENDDENADIHNHYYSPQLIFYGNDCRHWPEGKPLGSARFFGVELEVNSYDCGDDASFVLDALGRSHVYLKTDSSIGEGFEIVSHPHTPQGHKKLWGKLFSQLPRRGLTSYKSGRCGMHIHVSKQSVSERARRRIIAFLNDDANKDYVYAIAQRSSEEYARIKTEKKKVREFQWSDDRYEIYNITNSQTDELRMFRGTTLGHRFFKNIEFFDALLDYTEQAGIRDLTFNSFLAFAEKQANRWRYLHNFHVEKSLAAGKILPHGKGEAITTRADDKS